MWTQKLPLCPLPTATALSLNTFTAQPPLLFLSPLYCLTLIQALEFRPVIWGLAVNTIRMPSTIAKLNPLILKLALRAPLSKTKEDWQLHSPVDDLYNNDMKILMEAHCKQLGSEIALSDGIQKAASQLLDKYGPVLWPNQEHRPWLLGVGETFKGVGLCARSCRWDDRDDRE